MTTSPYLITTVFLGITTLCLSYLCYRLFKHHLEVKHSHSQLQMQLTERSQKLKGSNDQLYEEIAKHEITEELLRETQDYINCILNSMPSVLIGVTRTGIITHWNEAAHQYTNIAATKALGGELGHIAPMLGIDLNVIESVVDTNKPQKRENIKEGHGSQATYHDLTVYPLLSSEINGAVIRIDDITLRVRLETMMIQNEKMRSLGELAAGVAHEINNPLSIILQGAQNLQRRIDPHLAKNQTIAESLNIPLEHVIRYLEARKIDTFLSDIKSAGERAASIVSNMLGFSRAQQSDYSEVNINELLDQSISLSVQSFSLKKARVKIDKQLSSTPIYVPCSAPEIQQVILNLINNAHQAASSSEQKELAITVRSFIEDNHAIIEVEDNGPGMNSWVKKHIFDPFFTTKEVGKGTGLGLSVSYFIITEHHQGTMEVHSNKGEGSLFRIALPLEAQSFEL